MTAPPAISEGATGPRVKWAQYLLVCRALSCNQIDGIFGPVTKTAVGEYQRDSHLPADGVVGLRTWAYPCTRPAMCSPTCAVSRAPEPDEARRATGSFAARPSRDVINLRSVPRAISSGSPRAMPYLPGGFLAEYGHCCGHDPFPAPTHVADEQEGSRTSHVAPAALAGERTSARGSRAIVLRLSWVGCRKRRNK